MRLYVLVEGQTEEAFVKSVLMPHLAAVGVEAAGLPKLRAACPGFHRWVSKLETLGKP